MLLTCQKIEHVAFRRVQTLVTVTRPIRQEYGMLLITDKDAVAEGKADPPLDRNDKAGIPSPLHFDLMSARILCKKTIRYGGYDHSFHSPPP